MPADLCFSKDQGFCKPKPGKAQITKLSIYWNWSEDSRWKGKTGYSEKQNISTALTITYRRNPFPKFSNI